MQTEETKTVSAENPVEPASTMPLKKTALEVIAELEQVYSKSAKTYNETVERMHKAKEEAYQASLEMNRALQTLLLNKENFYNNIIQNMDNKIKDLQTKK